MGILLSFISKGKGHEQKKRVRKEKGESQRKLSDFGYDKGKKGHKKWDRPRGILHPTTMEVGLAAGKREGRIVSGRYGLGVGKEMMGGYCDCGNPTRFWRVPGLVTGLGWERWSYGVGEKGVRQKKKMREKRECNPPSGVIHKNVTKIYSKSPEKTYCSVV